MSVWRNRGVKIDRPIDFDQGARATSVEGVEDNWVAIRSFGGHTINPLCCNRKRISVGDLLLGERLRGCAAIYRHLPNAVVGHRVIQPLTIERHSWQYPAVVRHLLHSGAIAMHAKNFRIARAA